MEKLRNKRDAYYFKCTKLNEYSPEGCNLMSEKQFIKWATYDRKMNKAAAQDFKTHNFNIKNYCVFVDGLFRGSFFNDLEAINAVINTKMYPEFPFHTLITFIEKNNFKPPVK